MGQMWAAAYALCLCFMTLLLDSPVSCDTIRKLGSPKSGFQTVAFVRDLGNVEKQKLFKTVEDSLRTGKGIGSSHQFHSGTMVSSASAEKVKDMQAFLVTKKLAQSSLMAENATSTREGLRNEKVQKGKRIQNSKVNKEKRGKFSDDLLKSQQERSKISQASSKISMEEKEIPNAALAKTKKSTDDIEEKPKRNKVQTEMKKKKSVPKSVREDEKELKGETLELAEEILSPDESDFGNFNSIKDDESSRDDKNEETQDLTTDKRDLNQAIADGQVDESKDDQNEETQDLKNDQVEFHQTTADGKAKMQRSTVNMKESTENSTETVEDTEDEYSDFIQEFADLPSKFQDTAGKVADRLMPEFQKFSNKSKLYFNRANEGITEGFRPLVGNQSYFPLQRVLLYVNIYLAAYFATLMLASFLIGMEPMGFFFRNSLSGAMAQKLPRTSWKIHGMYTLAFFILCLFAKIKQGKKEYIQQENGTSTDKKN
eukprot:Gb_15335 [translate_table: standard]